MSEGIESSHSNTEITTDSLEISHGELTSPDLEGVETDFEDCGLKEAGGTDRVETGNSGDTGGDNPDDLFGDCGLEQTETPVSPANVEQPDGKSEQDEIPTVKNNDMEDTTVKTDENKDTTEKTDEMENTTDKTAENEDSTEKTEPPVTDLRALEADNRTKLEEARTSLQEADALSREKMDAVMKEDKDTEAYRTALAEFNQAREAREAAANRVSELEKNGADLRDRLEQEHRQESELPPQKAITTEEGKVRTDDNGKVHMYREDGQWKLMPNCEYTSQGYDYQTDDKGRITHVEGTLRLSDESRKSLNAKVEDMEESDQRGHIIADRFDASNRIDNLVPQLAEVNQGEYKALENKMADAVADGHTVDVEYDVLYEDDSKRPTGIYVQYWIDGQYADQIFDNVRR